MADWKTLRIIELPTYANGKVSAEIVVDFTVGDDGPFTERFAKSEFSDSAMRERLTAFAGTIQRARA